MNYDQWKTEADCPGCKHPESQCDCEPEPEDEPCGSCGTTGVELAGEHVQGGPVLQGCSECGGEGAL